MICWWCVTRKWEQGLNTKGIFSDKLLQLEFRKLTTPYFLNICGLTSTWVLFLDKFFAVIWSPNGDKIASSGTVAGTDYWNFGWANSLTPWQCDCFTTIYVLLRWSNLVLCLVKEDVGAALNWYSVYWKVWAMLLKKRRLVWSLSCRLIY